MAELSESSSARETEGRGRVQQGHTAEETPKLPRDFGFLPIPKRLHWDPEKAPVFSYARNLVFGITCTFIVANLYWCQPLLIQLSASFGVSYNEVSRIPTLLQAGYAVGLLLISPLGDLLPRRPLLLGVVFVSASLTIGLAVTRSIIAFEAISFFVGMFTIAPQILIPLAADLAPAERRGSAIAVVLSGLLLGVLVARVIAGIVAEFTTWRVVYYISVGTQYSMLVLLYFVVPDYPAKNKGMTYFDILWSMGKLAVTEPKLFQACLVLIGSNACYSNFWVTLTFILGGSPYHYSTLVIGLFGLIGIFGVSLAPLVGRFVDRLVPWYATFLATVFMTLAWAIQTGAGGVSIAAIVVACLGLDLFDQMQQVSLTATVFSISEDARARLNAVLILSIFIGQVMGTAAGTKIFVEHGWRPHCPRHTWFGWQGGADWRLGAAMQNENENASAADGDVGPDLEKA